MGADSELSERSSEPAVDGNLKSGEGGVSVSMDGSGEAGGRGLAEQAASAGASLTTVNLTARSSSAAGGVGDSGSAALTGTAPPILVRDSHSHTSTAAAVAFPFNELSSPRLLTVARQTAPRPPGDKQADEPKRKTRPGTKRRTAPSTAPSDLSSCSAPSATSHSSTSSSPRTTPTRVGERDSFEAATGGPSAGAGSYKGTVVRLATLHTNNWASLLRFRHKVIRTKEIRTGQQYASEGVVVTDTISAQMAECEEHKDYEGCEESDEPELDMDSSNNAKLASGRTVHSISSPRQRPLSPQTREQIRRLVDSGLGASQVARRCGVHEGTVRAIWRAPLKTQRQGWHRFSDEDCWRAKQMLARGKTLIEIGLVLGFDRSTVRKHLSSSLVYETES